jgi:hypothetical protein
LEYVKLEPHAFLHAGAISNLISKRQLDTCSAVSIGMDLLKDAILIKNNKLALDVYDIDGPGVIEANLACARLGIEADLKYHNRDFLSDSDLESGKYRLAILCQMDYVFDDSNLRKIAKEFSDKKIQNLIILTPSAFEIEMRKDPTKLIEAGFKVLAAIRSKGKTGGDYETYSRNVRYLIGLFEGSYKLIQKTDYLYPSGREFLFYFELR